MLFRYSRLFSCRQSLDLTQTSSSLVSDFDTSFANAEKSCGQIGLQHCAGTHFLHRNAKHAFFSAMLRTNLSRGIFSIQFCNMLRKAVILLYHLSLLRRWTTHLWGPTQDERPRTSPEAGQKRLRRPSQNSTYSLKG